MLSIAKIVSEEYLISLASEDYFFKGGEPPGRWAGGAAKKLGLSGTVRRKDHGSLWRGFDPTTGKALVQNAGAPNRQPGWDFTFSAPKSVSVVWSRAQDQDRRAIQEIQQQAAEEALSFAEQYFAYARTGKAGMGERVPVELLAATFEHGTSRANDPQLHTHAFVFNLGVDQKGDTRTIVSRLLYQQKKVFGAFYRAHLAHDLEKKLGIRCRRHGDSFEIEGVPQHVIDANSKRRKQILKRLHELSTYDAKTAARAALETRTKKDVPPRKQLLHEWQANYDALGFTEADLEKLIHPQLRDNQEFIPLALKTAAQNITASRPYFRPTDFLFEVLCTAPEFGIPPQDLLEPVQQFLATSEALVPIPTDSGETLYTTTENLKAEQKLLELAIQMTARSGAKVSDRIRQRVLKENRNLNDEQRAAFDHLIESKSSLRFLHGMAGTGKTSHVLSACIDAWEQAGYEVIGATPTGKAARVLEDEADIASTTIHRALVDFEIKQGLNLRHHLKQFGRALRGKQTYRPYKPKKVPIGKKTILVVDEAGMVNTRHFQMLMDHVQKGGGTLVFAGDPNQLPPVEGTAPFMSLSRRVGYQQLTDIQRQEQQWARDAARLFAQGEAGKALSLYAERDLLITCDDRDTALTTMVDQWAETHLKTPQQGTILTLTNLESDEANRLCQQRRLAATGKTKHKSVTATDTRFDGEHQCQLYQGDRVLFTKKSTKYGVENGTLGTVRGIQPHSNTIHVDLDRGERVEIPLDLFPHVRLGYAMTTHKAQGTTLQDVFLLVGGYLQNRSTTYVQATRARGTTRFYTTKDVLKVYQNAEESILVRQMSERPDLRLAMDMFQVPHFASTNRVKVTDRLLRDWFPAAKLGKDTPLIVTDSQADADEWNKRCHERLTSHTLDGTPPPTLTSEEGVELAPGTRLMLTGGVRGTNLKKGHLATVTDVDVQRGAVELRVDHLKEKLRILPENLRFVKHAYALYHRQLQELRHERKQQHILRYSDRTNDESRPYTTPPPARPTPVVQPSLQNPAQSYQQPLWAYQPAPEHVFHDQQHYLYMGAGAMQQQKQLAESLQAAQQILNQQTQALSQQQMQQQSQSWSQYQSITQHASHGFGQSQGF